MYCAGLQAEAQRQLEEQQEKQGRALKALQRVQKLLATHVSMQQHAAGAGGQQQQQPRGSSSGTSSGSSSGSSTSRREGAAEGSAAGALALADAAELEQDVQLSQLRLVLRCMLQELRLLDTQYPGGFRVQHDNRGDGGGSFKAAV